MRRSGTCAATACRAITSASRCRPKPWKSCCARKADMPVSFEGKIVVAISSRALFDFEEENRVFERDGEDAYVALQLGRLDTPAKKGVAFPLVQKLLAFNS